MKAFFTNRWSAPVPSITHWLRAKMPAATFKQSTTGRCEFVKNAFKKCSCCHFCLFMIFLFLLFISHTTEHYSNLHTENVCFTVLISIINFCLPLHKLKTNNIQHTHLHKFSNLIIVLTLDFWYMIKTKEATESAALEFCHILNKFAAQLDECLSVKDYWVQ